MSATELTAIGVDPAVVDMMDAVFADYRDTHPPAPGASAATPHCGDASTTSDWCA